MKMNNKIKILFLCTGNSCRSQMAEGFLKSFDANLAVFSAGTNPSTRVHPKAIRVMKEAGIDLDQNYPKDVAQFIDQSFDYVITVCGNAQETCPVFMGEVNHQVHIGFEDPAEAQGRITHSGGKCGSYRKYLIVLTRRSGCSAWTQ